MILRVFLLNLVFAEWTEDDFRLTWFTSHAWFWFSLNNIIGFQLFSNRNTTMLIWKFILIPKIKEKIMKALIPSTLMVLVAWILKFLKIQKRSFYMQSISKFLHWHYSSLTSRQKSKWAWNWAISTNILLSKLKGLVQIDLGIVFSKKNFISAP